MRQVNAKTRKTIYNVGIALAAFIMVFFVWKVGYGSIDQLSAGFGLVVSVATLLTNMLAKLHISPDLDISEIISADDVDDA